MELYKDSVYPYAKHGTWYYPNPDPKPGDKAGHFPEYLIGEFDNNSKKMTKIQQ